MSAEINNKNFENLVEPIIKQIEELTKVQRIIICILSFVLIVVIFVYGLYMPRFEKIGKLEKENEETAVKLETAKNKAKYHAKYSADLKEAEAQFKTTMVALPDKKEIPSLLSAISQSGNEAGMDFLLFEPKPEVVKDFFAEIPVNIKIRGTFPNLMIFFDKISRLYRIVNLKDIKITGDDKDKNILLTTGTAVTYKFVEKKEEEKKPDKKADKKSKKQNKETDKK
jgi:type IV pilus assembly protein PilO